MYVEHRGVSYGYGRRVVYYEDPPGEGLCDLRRVARVTCDVSPLDLVPGYPLGVEADVVARTCCIQPCVVGLDGVALARLPAWQEDEVVVDLQGARLDLPHGDGSDAPDGVDLLHGDPEGLVNGLRGHLELVEGLQYRGPLVPWHIFALVVEVVAFPTGCGDEVDLVHVVAHHLQKPGHAVLDLLVPHLAPVHGLVVHLVDGHHQLVDPQGLGQEGVLPGLTARVGARLVLTPLGGDEEDGPVGLAGSRDHVLDEVPVARRVDDREEVLIRLQLVESQVDRQAPLTLLLEVVEDPGVLEGLLAEGLSLLLEVLDLLLADSSGVIE
ncbi:hypothetical protein ES703_117370 [subsurface metagenome]